MISERSIELIKRHEGLRLKPYLDTEGILTVGYGHNLEQDITKDFADYLLREDLSWVQDALKKYDWYGDLNPPRCAVVENMMFNLGASRFAGFKKTIAYIEEADYKAASVEMLDSKWARQVGSRAFDLSRMMHHGEW